jgi:hypothetical protein
MKMLMKSILIIIPVALSFLMACGQGTGKEKKINPADSTLSSVVDSHKIQVLLNPTGTTIKSRFNSPSEYKRIESPANSFAAYLRTLPLKPDGSFVQYYDGGNKSNGGVYEAVVDLPIGNKDLHQCADAVMRLRAEYLYRQKQYDKIHFNLTNGFRVDYSKWMQGYRILVKGNITSWVRSAQPSNNYSDFWGYMELIFSYAGTLSLSKELIPVELDSIRIGDVFIQGGSPGHAVLVVDMAIHSKTGEKIFILAQSYMPAQEIQILQNPSDKDLSPWYSINFGSVLSTPEWTFSNTDLKRFND